MQTAEQTLDSNFMKFDIEYRKDEGDPRRIFKSMVELIDGMETAGIVFLKGIDPTLTFQLGIEEIRSGSLITKVFGIVRRKNGERLPGEQEAVITKGVAKTGKKILKAQSKVNRAGHINEKKVAATIATCQKEVARAYSRISGMDVPLLVAKPFSEKQTRLIMSSLANGVLMLDQGDLVKIYIGTEPFKLNPALKPYGVEFNSPEELPTGIILTDSGTGPKWVRVLTPRYGSKEGWEITHEGQTYKTVILHDEWYERIHEQVEEVGPKDQLLVDAEFEMRKTPRGRASSICKIHRVVTVKKYHPEADGPLEGMGSPE